jgi:hypothetical protein
VSGRPTQEDIWSDPGAACDFATVKGTLIVRMPSSFAGWRWSGGLGRLVYPRNGSLPFRVSAPATRGVPWFAKEGNVLSACAIKATQPFERQLSLLTRSVTRPSLGPRARARRSSLTSPVKADEGDAFGEGSRLGKPGNRRNQHRLLVSRTKRGSTRIPTLARGTQGMRQKRKEVAASVPSRISRVPVGVPARRYAVAEIVRGGIRSRIRSRAAPSKRERGASERGPSPV